MKDALDTKTLDLIPTPKKRGRPSTGRAKSAAERMRDVRRRDVRKIGVDGQGFAAMTLTGLYDHLRWSVKHGHVSDIQRICDELKGRALSQVGASHVQSNDFRVLYEALVSDLLSLERRTGLYLLDQCVDIENIDRNLQEGSQDQYRALYYAACSSAGDKACSYGHDINVLLGRVVY